MPSFSACVHFIFTVFKLIQCFSMIGHPSALNKWYIIYNPAIVLHGERWHTYLILNVLKNKKKLYALEKKNILRLVVISTSQNTRFSSVIFNQVDRERFGFFFLHTSIGMQTVCLIGCLIFTVNVSVQHLVGHGTSRSP